MIIARLRHRGHPPVLTASLIGAALALLVGGMYLLLLR
jgi:hypothetical protein